MVSAPVINSFFVIEKLRNKFIAKDTQIQLMFSLQKKRK